jgi:anti-sigma B factor antagonist
MILLLAKHELKQGVTVIEMKGSIHAGTDCRRLELEVDHLINAKTALVILDFSNITHIDSSAIGSLVRCHSLVKKSGAVMRIAGVKGMLDGALKLTKVDKLVEIYPTAPAAAENFTAPGAAGA